jgi:(p)ppGpp synthase/HD superfamily hydrolase
MVSLRPAPRGASGSVAVCGSGGMGESRSASCWPWPCSSLGGSSGTTGEDSYHAAMLTDRFQQALIYAAQVHDGQSRKGGESIPYLAHLMSVAALVLENGGGEDEAIAALLHDAIEDRGDRTNLEELRLRFGDQVAFIVDACSDTDQLPKPPWQGRKQAYIDRMQTAPVAVLRVACADKVHNARSTLSDLHVYGAATWSKFGSTVEQQLWYYQTLSELFSRRLPGPLSDELARLVAEITERSAASI